MPLLFFKLSARWNLLYRGICWCFNQTWPWDQKYNIQNGGLHLKKKIIGLFQKFGFWSFKDCWIQTESENLWIYNGKHARYGWLNLKKNNRIIPKLGFRKFFSRLFNVILEFWSSKVILESNDTKNS